MHHSVTDWFKKHPLLMFLAALVIVDAALFSAFLHGRERSLVVAFLDIGQGDAVYVKAPNGNQLLYDAGPPTGAVLSELSKIMPFYDRSIDVAILSHPDLDHVGGFADVFDRYRVDVILESGASSTNGVFEVLERKITEKKIPYITARRGMHVDMGSGVVAEILYPDTDTGNMETNSASIVMRLRYASTTFLFSGDLPSREEQYLVSLDGGALRSNVLKLGHHGSRTSSSEQWLRAVAPEVAVVSAGKGNHYGHPHQEIVDFLRLLNIPLLATPQEGTIVFESDGTRVARK